MKNRTTYDRAVHDSSHPYTSISAELINNESLSGEERFLMIYLLGRSDDYVFNSSYFAANANDLFGWGRDKFYKTWMSLQDKGYISKVKLRVKGKIDGEHYTIHEILPESLKNQNTENPESGKSGIRQTSTLLSIDKPNIDKPTIDKLSNTNTNHNDGVNSYDDEERNKRQRIHEQQVSALFKHVKERNVNADTEKWRLTPKDEDLLSNAISMNGGLEGAKQEVDRVLDQSTMEYTSISYIFADMKNEVLYKEVDETFTEDSLEQILYCWDPKELYQFIKDVAYNYCEEVITWKPSDKDLIDCSILINHFEKINLAEKLNHGLQSAIKKNEWTFHQITYQAMAALNNYDEQYGL